MIKLLQLPIPEVHHLYTQGNIPLAAGYLKAYAIKNGAAKPSEIEILSRQMLNTAGDAAVLKLLTESSPVLVGFTSYMWNIERNLYLARQLKEKLPGITIVLGGPEITPDHPAPAHDAVDCFVSGEGEQAFSELLTHFKEKGKQGLKKIYHSSQPVDLSTVPNPYLEGMLTPEQGESIFLETMRGCPYTCKYCFYSKSFSCMRYFPEDHLPHLFELARQLNAEELYFMDPSFNATPGWKEKLELVRQLNTTGIAIHTETRLESITPEIARSMREAGFKSVEAGLQSTNERSLKAISRSWNRGRFIQGTELLGKEGIDVKTGVILGLPHDSTADFENTIDFVMQLDLEESMEIYPLSLIPGTQLRDEAEDLGVTYMDHPPYWVTSTRHMDERDLKSAVEMVEHKLGIEFFPPVIPHFHNLQPGRVHFLDLREKAECQLGVLYRYPEQVGHSLTILVNKHSIKGTDKKKLLELGNRIQRENPFTLVQLVLDVDAIPLRQDLEPLIRAFYRPRRYFNHIHRYKIDNQDMYSLRFFHLTANLETAEKYLYQPMFCDLVLRYTPVLLNKGQDLLEEKPILLLDSPIPQPELDHLTQIYKNFESFLILPPAGKNLF
jgi:radical SAM superfamily enzyme YgiQ (UPF0313 family)